MDRANSEGGSPATGRKVALAAIALALAVLGAGAVVLAPHVREWWYLRKLASEEEPVERQSIAARLAESGTVRAIEPLWRAMVEEAPVSPDASGFFEPVRSLVARHGRAAAPALRRILRRSTGVYAILAARRLLEVEPLDGEAFEVLLAQLASEEVDSTLATDYFREQEDGGIALLSGALRDPRRNGSESVRLGIIRSLAALADPETDKLQRLREKVLPILLEAVGDPALPVRFAAARAALAAGADREALLPFLVDALADPSLHGEAQSACGDHLEAVPACRLALVRDDEPTLLWALGQLDHNVGHGFPGANLSAVERVLGHASLRVRVAAAGLLGQLGGLPDRFQPVLLEGLRDPRAEVRAEAARFIGEIGPVCAEAVPSLREGLKDEALSVRVFSAIASLELGGDPATLGPVILEGLGADKDPDLKNAAQNATLSIQHGGRPYLLEPLAEPARRPLARALAGGDLETALPLLQGSFPFEMATATLTACLGSEDADLRRDAIRALVRLGPVARAARPTLEAALAGETAEFREEVRRIAGGPDAKAREEIARQTEHAFREKEYQDRVLAAQKVGLLGIRDAAPFLTALKAPEDSEAHERAIDALGRIGPISEAEIPALIALLEDPNYYHRAGAASLLAEFGPAARPAVPVLEKLLLDRTSYARSAARGALAAIGRE
jgi:HEAT repeat protein